MAKMDVGRILAMALMAQNCALYLVVLGLSGHFLNQGIDGSFGGNGATSYMVIFALIAGAVGIASIGAGVHHLKQWKPETLAATSAVTWVSWLLGLLAMGLAWKEIEIGRRSAKHRVLESFLIILSFTQLLYLMMLHLGVFGPQFGPGYQQRDAPVAAMAEVLDPKPDVEAPVVTTTPPAVAAAAAV